MNSTAPLLLPIDFERGRENVDSLSGTLRGRVHTDLADRDRGQSATNQGQ